METINTYAKYKTVNIYKYHQFKILYLLTGNCLELQTDQTVVLYSPFPKLSTPLPSTHMSLQITYSHREMILYNRKLQTKDHNQFSS